MLISFSAMKRITSALFELRLALAASSNKTPMFWSRSGFTGWVALCCAQ
jgi:hypothetical protein